MDKLSLDVLHIQCKKAIDAGVFSGSFFQFYIEYIKWYDVHKNDISKKKSVRYDVDIFPDRNDYPDGHTGYVIYKRDYGKWYDQNIRKNGVRLTRPLTPDEIIEQDNAIAELNKVDDQ
jgi:hypothetical protein